MRSPQKNLITGLLALTGFFGVIILYYISHKPLTPALAAALAKTAWQLAAAAALIFVAGGSGDRLWRLFFPAGDTLNGLTRLALQAGLGLGALALGYFLLGALFGLPGWLPWVLLVLLLALNLGSGRRWLDQLSALRPLWAETSTALRGLAGLQAVILAATLLVALAPPLKFDALTYHLLLPQAYLNQGKISYLPWMVMSGMPQNTETLYTWVIALAGKSAATALAWFFGPLTLLGLLGALRDRLNADAAWVGAASLMAGITTALLTGWGYVDWLVMLMGLGALEGLNAWLEGRGSRWLVLAGSFIGLAVGIKYTSGVLALAGLGVVIWQCLRRKQALIPAGLRLGLPAVALAAPWLLKNWMSTSNPLYPFLFTGGAMNAVRLSVYQKLPPWGNALDFFLLPLRATYLGVDAGDGYMAAIGPLLLGLGALAWLGRRERRSLAAAPLLAGLGLLIWAVGNQFSGNLIQTRYYFSIFPAFAVLAAAGYHGLSRLSIPQVRLGRIVNALLLLVMTLNSLEIITDVARSTAFQTILGLKSEEQYLADNLGWYQPAMQAVRELPPGKRALLIFEARSLYCYPRCAPDEILDRWKRDRAALGDAQTIRQEWLRQGFTHVLFYRTGADFLVEANDPHHSPQDLQALKDFLATLPAPRDFGGVYQLYDLE